MPQISRIYVISTDNSAFVLMFLYFQTLYYDTWEYQKKFIAASKEDCILFFSVIFLFAPTMPSFNKC